MNTPTRASAPMPFGSARKLAGCVLYPLGIGIPVLAIIGGAWMWRSETQTLRRAALVRAVVESVGVSPTRWIRASSGVSYTPFVRYSYEVDGRHYVARSLNARAQRASSLESALARAHRYHVGDNVTAWYDREQPNVAFLEPARSAFPIIWTLIWATVMAIALSVIRQVTRAISRLT